MLKVTVINWEVAHTLGLSPMEYVVIDSIHHLSANKKSSFSGWCYMSRTRMADQFHLSKTGVIKIIQRLEDKGLIEKHDMKGYLRPTIAWHNTYLSPQNQDWTDGKQSAPDGKQSAPDIGKQSVPNISITNKGIKEEDITPIIPLTGDVDSQSSLNENLPKKNRSPGRAKFVPDLSMLEDQPSRDMVMEFVEYRQKIGKAFKAQIEFDKFIARLRKLAGGSFQRAQAILDNSMAGGWPSIWPIKNEGHGKTEPSIDEARERAARITAGALKIAENFRGRVP